MGQPTTFMPLFSFISLLATANELKSELEIPKEKSNGDLAASIAMKAARFARKSPSELAEIIKVKFEEGLAKSPFKKAIDRVEVKTPGFINFFLSKDYLCKILLEIKRRKNNYGRSAIGSALKLQVEFVSANPTGPLTIAHGRQAALGDSLANILEFLGYKVTREYYLNDEGTQMEILGNSIRMRYLELFGLMESFPADGYKGSYVTEIAGAFRKKHGKKFIKSENNDIFREFGLRWILNDIKKDMTQQTRGAVGTFDPRDNSKVTGYTKDYSYDARLLTAAPPCFPVTRDSNGNILYNKITWIEH